MSLSHSFRERIRSTPWWMISILFHFVLIVLLARVDLSTSAIATSKSTFELTIDFDERIEETPLKKIEEPEEVDELEKLDEQNLSELLSQDMEVESLDIDVEDIASLGELMGDNLLGSEVASLGGRQESYEEIPVISTPTARRLKPGDITVARGGYQQITSSIQSDARRYRKRLFVWLFDESWSMKDDQQDIMKRIQEIYTGLGEDLDDNEESEKEEKPKASVISAVVSFGKTVGKKTNLLLAPTRNLSHVQKAIEQIPIDKSGQENTLEAIRFCSTKFRRYKKVIILVTDENVSDMGSGEPGRTLQHLRKSGTPLFVMSREALFGQSATRESVAFTEAEKKEYGANWGWVRRGPETAVAEWFPSFDRVWSPHLIGSGFPIYELAALAKGSRGRYYILAAGSSGYDDEKMKNYAPELCSRKEYEKRTQRNALRKKFKEVLDKCISGRPRTSFPNTKGAARDSALEGANSAKNMIKFCLRSIKELESFKNLKKYDKQASKRWEANYDLLVAHLWGYIYQLKEYRVAVERFRREGPFGDPQKTGNYYLNFKRGVPPSNDELKQDKDNAAKAYQSVIKKHSGTPWARMAQMELSSLSQLQAYRAGKPSPDQKPPPQL